MLRLIAEGGTRKAVAQDLGITVKAVHFHLANVRRRTGAGSGRWGLAAAVETAYATGLLPRPALLPDRLDLTERQRVLILLLAGGLTIGQIAAALDCSPRKAVSEFRDLEKSLGATSPAHLITRARQYGLPTSDAAGG
ncbi:LuxR C-terminal-related transcriptional regulator [Streptomyces sp. 4F14]|uniref:LuxR C-terminal-related transcriptional regulator n=1 Tax=Streptomyces sp. 4F14 TaxID=3394380 RepID=UPI003A86AFFD